LPSIGFSLTVLLGLHLLVHPLIPSPAPGLAVAGEGIAARRRPERVRHRATARGQFVALRTVRRADPASGYVTTRAMTHWYAEAIEDIEAWQRGVPIWVLTPG